MEKHKNKITIFSIILILLIVRFCVPRESTDYKTLYEQALEQVEAVNKRRLKEKDSLMSLIYYREKETEHLLKSKVEYIDRIVKIKDEPKYSPESLEDAANYLINLYPKDTIETNGYRVEIDFGGTSKIINDLESKISLSEIVLYQDSIIYGDSIIISNLSKDKSDLKSMLLSAETEITERVNLNLIADSTIKTLNRKEKIGKILLGVLVPAGTIGGFILGHQLSK